MGWILLTNDSETSPRGCRVNDEEVRLMLWDTAGQEEFDAITKAYYRGKIPQLLRRGSDPPDG